MIVECTDQRLADGRVAQAVLLDDGGIRVMIASLGATLMRIDAPDRAGRMANVVLGSDWLADYPAAGAPGPNAYLGATCGRVANRLRDARYRLDGVQHRLIPNEGRHQLHGGPAGFDRRLWRTKPLDRGVRLSLVSADGDQGHPGRLCVTATFLLVDPESLLIAYRARTDRPTHANIVSHPYFNLAGDGRGTIDEHLLSIGADAFLPIDGDALPTGGTARVAGTAFDFRTARRVGAAGPGDHAQLRVGGGYNHCYQLRGRAGRMRPAACLHDPASGRTMALSTDQPGLHFYSGDWLEPAGGHAALRARAGLCLEAEGYPDAANLDLHPSTRLDPGRLYRSRTLLRFGRAG